MILLFTLTTWLHIAIWMKAISLTTLLFTTFSKIWDNPKYINAIALLVFGISSIITALASSEDTVKYVSWFLAFIFCLSGCALLSKKSNDG